MDDRSFIEVGSDVMRTCPDHLDAPLVCLVIRLCALEAGQEAVMDVDAPPAEMRGLFVGQDLHVPRQHDQLGPTLFGDCAHLCFLRAFLAARHGKVMEGNVSQMRMLDCRARMIGDDCHGLHRQFADAPAVQ